jgi:flagellar motor protein MotB
MNNDLEKLNILSEQKSNIWMLSFVDTLSILITFFILVYATSSPFHGANKDNLIANNYVNQRQELDNIKYIHDIILSKITKAGLHDKICVIENVDNIEILISADNLFAGMGDRLQFSAENILLIVADIIDDIDNSITITGINSPDYIIEDKNNKEKFKSPLNRAIMIARKLWKLGYDRNIQTIGLLKKSYNLKKNICKMNLLSRIMITINNYKY